MPKATPLSLDPTVSHAWGQTEAGRDRKGEEEYGFAKERRQAGLGADLSADSRF